MMAHLLPCSLCACGQEAAWSDMVCHGACAKASFRVGVFRTAMILASSSSLKGSFFTQGLSWLHHLKRQDLPLRPWIPWAMTDQLRAPCLQMSAFSSASSCTGGGGARVSGGVARDTGGAGAPVGLGAALGLAPEHARGAVPAEPAPAGGRVWARCRRGGRVVPARTSADQGPAARYRRWSGAGGTTRACERSSGATARTRARLGPARSAPDTGPATRPRRPASRKCAKGLAHGSLPPGPPRNATLGRAPFTNAPGAAVLRTTAARHGCCGDAVAVAAGPSSSSVASSAASLPPSAAASHGAGARNGAAGAGRAQAERAGKTAASGSAAGEFVTDGTSRRPLLLRILFFCCCDVYYYSAVTPQLGDTEWADG